MSIVKRFSQQIKTIESLTKISSVGLNKTSPKSNYNSYGQTKGVDADHIKIFKINSDKSFAFAFYYLHAEKNTDSSPYVIVTLKIGEKISSSLYKQESFKAKINQFINLLHILKEADSLNELALEKTVVNNFLKEMKTEEAFAEEIEKAKAKVESILVKHAAAIEKPTLKQAKLKVTHLENEKAIKSEIAELKKQLDFEDISKQYNECVKKVESLQKKMEEKLRVKQIKEELIEIAYTLRDSTDKKARDIKAEIQKLPPVVQHNLTDLYKDYLK